jgi:hypothetical protein
MDVISGWTYKYDYIPGKKGNYFTIEKDGMEVDAMVTGWLDEDLQPIARCRAVYINARRHSYNNGGRDGVLTNFAIKLY